MDTSKHQDIFDPTKMCGKKILILGVGAVGSITALNLAKLGIQDITVRDGDVIEPHNIANQALYGPADIGESKAKVVSDAIYRLTGISVKYDDSFYSEGKLFYEYIFACVDSMAIREKVFKQGIFINGCTELFLESRMNARSGAIYCFNPSDLNQVNEYKETLYPDSEVRNDAGTCGVTPSIGATAQLCSSYLTWLFMKSIRDTTDCNEILFSVEPMTLVHRRF
jgi:molybdopterin/thiamine biosynthesis adenylyltransferase